MFESLHEQERRKEEKLPAYNKHKIPSEAVKMMKQERKSSQLQEVPVVKKTSLPKKVKIGSKMNSPSLKRRFKTQQKAANGALLKLASQDANSPVKISKFKTLLKSWELSSSNYLTSEVEIPPRSSQNVDSQPENSLQTKNILATGICSAIGQENSETGLLLDMDQ